jgi:hypothetical protein
MTFMIEYSLLQVFYLAFLVTYAIRSAPQFFWLRKNPGPS